MALCRAFNKILLFLRPTSATSKRKFQQVVAPRDSTTQLKAQSRLSDNADQGVATNSPRRQRAAAADGDVDAAVHTKQPCTHSDRAGLGCRRSCEPRDADGHQRV